MLPPRYDDPPSGGRGKLGRPTRATPGKREPRSTPRFPARPPGARRSRGRGGEWIGARACTGERHRAAKTRPTPTPRRAGLVGRRELARATPSRSLVRPMGSPLLCGSLPFPSIHLRRGVRGVSEWSGQNGEDLRALTKSEKGGSRGGAPFTHSLTHSLHLSLPPLSNPVCLLFRSVPGYL